MCGHNTKMPKHKYTEFQFRKNYNMDYEIIFKKYIYEFQPTDFRQIDICLFCFSGSFIWNVQSFAIVRRYPI